MPEGTTIIACSTALSAIIFLILFLTWLRDGRRTQNLWFSLPFGFGVMSGLLLGFPEVLPDRLALQLGYFFLLMIHASAWQAARAINGLRPKTAHALIPCLAWLAFYAVFAREGSTALTIASFSRVLIPAGFNLLAALEFRRMRNTQLPSANLLYVIFAAYALIDFLRSPLALVLPSPLGPAEPELWSILMLCLLIVVQGLLVTVFVTALMREQVAAKHYRLASVDPLTGAGNRRALRDRLTALAKSWPDGTAFGVIAFDIDSFKRINDRHGHAFGDVVIVAASRIAQQVTGAENVFRTGGEEFVCIAAGMTGLELFELGERLRVAFESHARVIAGTVIDATISIGIAAGHTRSALDTLVIEADEALYEAKRQGRNRTILDTGTTICGVRFLPPTASLPPYQDRLTDLRA